jgi:cytochrome bd-type quinol oxidase subunit 2
MQQRCEKLALKDVVRNVLEEVRMVLPGVQALFGFQLVAVFNAGFSSLPDTDKILHMAALLLTIGTIACLMAPASYHRQVLRDSVSQQFVDYASKLLCIGMVPLLFSITLDTYVVCNAITNKEVVAAAAAGYCFFLLLTLWYVVPAWRKMHNRIEDNELTATQTAERCLSVKE